MGGRYPQCWCPRFSVGGGHSSPKASPAKTKRWGERERQTAAFLPPPCAAHPLWVLKWNQPATQPGSLAPAAAPSTLSLGMLITPPQVRKPNGEERLGMIAACVPSACSCRRWCCWQAEAAPAQGKVLISHRWSEVKEIQSAGEAEADRQPPCYSHGNAQLHSVQCLPRDQFPVIRGLWAPEHESVRAYKIPIPESWWHPLKPVAWARHYQHVLPSSGRHFRRDAYHSYKW